MTPVNAVTGSKHRDRVTIACILGVVEGERSLTINTDRNIISDIADNVIQFCSFSYRKDGLHACQVVDDFNAHFLIAKLKHLAVNLSPEVASESTDGIHRQPFRRHI